LETLDRGAIQARFEAEYARLYRKIVPGGVPEAVTWRVSGSSEFEVKHFRLGTSRNGSGPGKAEANGVRSIYRPDEKRYVTVAVYDRYQLAPGTRLQAPLILTEPESTLVVAYPAVVSVLSSGSVEVVLEGTP